MDISISGASRQNPYCDRGQWRGNGRREGAVIIISRDMEWTERRELGLVNVFERIQLYYGKEAAWHISSVKGVGTLWNF